MSKSEHSYVRRQPKRFGAFNDIEEFTIIDELGKGGYSIVYLVEHKKSKKNTL